MSEDELDIKLQNSLLKSKQSLKEILAPFYKPTSPEDKTLIFESRFESGNLCMALKIHDQEYNLLMQNDVNSQGHNQWFYFRVMNTRAKSSIRFNILNFVYI